MDGCCPITFWPKAILLHYFRVREREYNFVEIRAINVL